MKFSPNKKLISASAFGLALGTTACMAPMPVASSYQDPNPIVAACVWPNKSSTASYVTSQGDIYQVTVINPYLAFEAASLNGGNVIVQATYDATSAFPVHVNTITGFDLNQQLPSQAYLETSRNFKFGEAAAAALNAATAPSAPLQACWGSAEVNGWRRADPRGVPGFVP